MCFRQRTAKHRKVLRENINRATINATVSCYNTITEIFFFINSKICCTVLRNMITLATTHGNIEFAIIGAVILTGVIADELVKRYAAKRRARLVL